MSLASERREAELERANYAKAVKAMQASGGTFSGGATPGTFKTPDGKTIVGDPNSGVYDMASLKKAAKQAAATGQTGVTVTVNGQPMMYFDESMRNNQGIPASAWTKGGAGGGFADLKTFNDAHPQSRSWVDFGPLLVGGIAGAGLLAGGAGGLFGGAAEGAGGAIGGAAEGVGGALGAEVGAGQGLGLNLGMEGTLGGGLGTAAGGSGLGLATPSLGAGAAGSEFALGSGALSGAGAGAGLTAGGALGGSGSLLSGLGSLASGAGSAIKGLVPSGGGDLSKLLGAALPAGLGYLGASSQSDAMKDIYNQTRADRMPALNAYNSALQNPNTFYQSAPAMGAVDAVLRKLSVNGNPAANPGSLSQAAAYNLGGYNDYLRGLTPAAFGTANTEANVGMNQAGADAGKYNAVGWGLNQFMNPQPDYTQSLNKLALAIGGMKL